MRRESDYKEINPSDFEPDKAEVQILFEDVCTLLESHHLKDRMPLTLLEKSELKKSIAAAIRNNMYLEEKLKYANEKARQALIDLMEIPIAAAITDFLNFYGIEQSLYLDLKWPTETKSKVFEKMKEDLDKARQQAFHTGEMSRKDYEKWEQGQLPKRKK